MKKKIDYYSETLFHLINFRFSQYRDSKKMIGIDYDSFIIISCIGSHYLRNNTIEASNWDSVWEQTRSKNIEKSNNQIVARIQFKKDGKPILDEEGYQEYLYEMNIDNFVQLEGEDDLSGF